MELAARRHYLSYRVPAGAQVRYLARAERTGEAVLACLQWTSAAWKMAARDRWIGWSETERARNLVFIVNNNRFLVLPWVRVKGRPARSWRMRHASCPVTGSGATATGRRCRRRWWTAGGSRALATGPPTGSRWEKPPDAAAWTVTTKPNAPRATGLGLPPLLKRSATPPRRFPAAVHRWRVRADWA